MLRLILLTPGDAHFGHPVLQVRERRRAVSTALCLLRITLRSQSPAYPIHGSGVRRSAPNPCANETMIDFLSITLRADPPPPAAPQGPRKAAGIVPALRQQQNIAILETVRRTRRLVGPWIMTDRLRLTFEADTDGTCELIAEVRANGFRGVSSAWFNNQELTDFAQKLAKAYPLESNSPLKLEGGFWSKAKHEAIIEQLHVGLRFYPIGRLGRVGCRVSLSTPIHANDRPEAPALVAVELQTTYEQLSTFARALELLATKDLAEAVLESAA